MTMRALPFLLAGALGVGCALLVACGSDRQGLIPARDASRLDRALNAVAAASSSGDCAQASVALAQAKGALINLPDSVDARLRSRLRLGIDNLEARVPVACAAAGTQTEPPPETPTEPETTPTETIPSTPVTTPTETIPSTPVTTPTDTTPTTPQTTPSVPATSVPPGNDTGGAGDQS